MMLNINEAKKYLLRRISSDETFEDLLHFPRFLEIETIHACNAKCTMCTINDWSRAKRLMSDDIFDKIASEIIDKAHEIKRVSLYKDGEPLLDLKLPSRIVMLKDGGIKNVAISTNVSLLTESRAREILESGLDTIIMSMDSIRRETYESIRVGLDFEQVLENAQRFIELRNRIRTQTKIWMRMILQEKNWDEWPEYHAFWSERMSSADRVYYKVIHNWGGQLNKGKPLVASYQPFLPCVALWSAVVIFANGDVPLCAVDYDNKYPLGNVAESSITALWHSEALTQKREKHLYGRKAEIAICEHCNVWDDSQDLKKVSIKPHRGERNSLVAKERCGAFGHDPNREGTP